MANGKPGLAGSYAGSPRRSGAISRMMTTATAGSRCSGCFGCRVAECWPLRVRIRRLGGAVEWSDFEGPLSSGGYDVLGPFLFNAEQYDRELAAILARAAD